MVFLILMGETIKTGASKSSARLGKESEAKIKGEMQKEIKALREEVASLKSTLLEHSMSLQTNVDMLQHRVSNVEGRSQEVRRLP
jgi:F0F1-type ATP synthase membrane subunit b/b'